MKASGLPLHRAKQRLAYHARLSVGMFMQVFPLFACVYTIFLLFWQLRKDDVHFY